MLARQLVMLQGVLQALRPAKHDEQVADTASPQVQLARWSALTALCRRGWGSGQGREGRW